ncbi:nuclear transport factor 2 family protein [Winogradskyella ursingii]|uniref:nuclear transport factor 2 family protein n=1 Tax=Winogradskyella ursingii TaxID=2686079 RepID=UPI0015C6BA10|nr:nuclear transport factor 2 family protein [Winogradskyella ursingii]
MKTQLLYLLIFFTSFVFSQTDTEIFLFDVEVNNSKISIKNGKNISNNTGYDNQPSFLEDYKILFSSTRNNQTDIAIYNLRDSSKIYVSNTDGGEYSPLKIPNKDQVSAVRLDPDGKQRLYSYQIDNGTSTELIKDLVIAYYTWFNKDIIVAAVIEGEQLNLYSINIEQGTHQKIANNVGRSFHSIPNSNLISFISKENDKLWQIKSLNPTTGKTKLIANTLKGVEDICWLNSQNLISGRGSILYKLRLNKDYNWKKVADLSNKGITNITRLAAHKDASKLLLTADVPANTVDSNITDSSKDLTSDKAAQIVQKHIGPFNDRNLDKFANAFTENVTVNRFPDENMYTGRDKLKENYKEFFKRVKNSNVKVLNRMILKNVVVDEELVTLDNATKRQVTIYETLDNGISSMTFIENSKSKKKSEILINEQLVRYNEKDIKAFGRTYAKNVKVYNYPSNLVIEGRDALRNNYITLFESAPDLYAEVENRIIIGDKVIDKEKVKINGEFVYVIAIYEIRNKLIQRVTFIQ